MMFLQIFRRSRRRRAPFRGTAPQGRRAREYEGAATRADRSVARRASAQSRSREKLSSAAMFAQAALQASKDALQAQRARRRRNGGAPGVRGGDVSHAQIFLNEEN